MPPKASAAQKGKGKAGPSKRRRRALTLESDSDHSELTESIRVLHIFMCYYIDPTSHRTEFNEDRARLIHHLARGRKLDLGRHIFDFITTLASQLDTARQIMFPCLISAICVAEGVELLPHEESAPLGATINRRTRESTKPRVPRGPPAPPVAPADPVLPADPAAPVEPAGPVASAHILAPPGDERLQRQMLSEMTSIGRTMSMRRET